MQVRKLHKHFDALQEKHGNSRCAAIYGAGCVDRPRAMFIFMNPTARNISARRRWVGLRAPWLGTKQVWKLFYRLGLLSAPLFRRTQELEPDEWTAPFSAAIYREIANRGFYITNLAKCTQVDARPLTNAAFRAYLPLMQEEIGVVRPKAIFSFGNQVSSMLLGMPVRASAYRGTKKETLKVGKETFSVYPVAYPVGQGMRNMPAAVRRISAILA